MHTAPLKTLLILFHSYACGSQVVSFLHLPFLVQKACHVKLIISLLLSDFFIAMHKFR